MVMMFEIRVRELDRPADDSLDVTLLHDAHPVAATSTALLPPEPITIRSHKLAAIRDGVAASAYGELGYRH